MSNYVRTADFAGKDALISGNPAKAVKGVDLGIEFDAIAAMSATKLDASNSANPTGTIGLTAVNGTAASFMRSDGTPALSQAIVPTWTGVHTFSALPVFNAGVTVNAATRNVASLGQTAQSYGNTTDNPTYTFLGTGNTTFSGSIFGRNAEGVVTLFGANSQLGVGIAFTTGQTELITTGTAPFGIGTSGVAALSFYTNSVKRVSIASSGALTFTDEAGTLQDAGFRGLPQNSQAANYTAVMADRGKSIYNTNGAGIVFTIPANASVAYPVGTTLTFVNAGGAAACTIAITTDTLIFAATAGTGSRTLAGSGMATAIKVTSNSWHISGAGLT